MAELLRHRLQRASYGASYSGPPVAALLGEAPVAGGSALALLGGDHAAEGLGAGTEKAGLGTGASGRFSGGSGARRRCRRARLRWQWGSALAAMWLLWHRR
jgi:hypothetical protein